MFDEAVHEKLHDDEANDQQGHGLDRQVVEGRLDKAHTLGELANGWSLMMCSAQDESGSSVR